MVKAKKEKKKSNAVNTVFLFFQTNLIIVEVAGTCMSVICLHYLQMITLVIVKFVVRKFEFVALLKKNGYVNQHHFVLI